MSDARRSRYLLDANVVIAAAVLEHERHEAANQWLAAVDRFSVCPIVEGALIRFLLRSGEAAITAGRLLAEIRAQPRCDFIADDLSYADVDVSSLLGHRQVTDAYLVRLARQHRHRLATFDEGLVQWHGADCFLVPT